MVYMCFACSMSELFSLSVHHGGYFTDNLGNMWEVKWMLWTIVTLIGGPRQRLRVYAGSLGNLCEQDLV